MYATALGALGWLFVRPPPFRPTLGSGIARAAAALACLYVGSALSHWPGAYEEQTLDWLSFLALAAGAAFAFRADPAGIYKFGKTYLWCAGFVCLYGFAQAAHWEPFPELIHNEYPGSFFGFQNMTAEFVGLAVLIQLFYFERLSATRLQAAWAYFFLSALVVYLTLLHCRSVYAALALGCLPFAFFRGGQLKWMSFGLAVLMAGLAIEPSVGSPDPNQVLVPEYHEPSRPLRSTQKDQLVKQGNSVLRYIRWRNTWNLIRQNPGALGPGNFEFGYIPYHASFAKDYESTEDSLVKAPHNGFLEIAAENGIASLAALLVLLGLLLRRILRFASNEYTPLFLSAFAYWCVDTFFAFPMEMALPFFAIAILLGGAISTTAERQRPVSRAGLRTVIAPIFVAIAMLTGFSLYSHIVEAHGDEDLAKISLACEIFPSNWHVCLRKAELEIDAQKNAKAIETTQAILRRQANNHLALQLLVSALDRESRIPEACEALARFDALFSHASSLHQTFTEGCP